MTLSISRDTPVRYYSGPERRLAMRPRRNAPDRRHRLRTESLISDCRGSQCRRAEDEDGYVIIPSLYADGTHPQNRE